MVQDGILAPLWDIRLVSTEMWVGYYYMREIIDNHRILNTDSMHRRQKGKQGK
jgi:hypothetical protein